MEIKLFHLVGILLLGDALTALDVLEVPSFSPISGSSDGGRCSRAPWEGNLAGQCLSQGAQLLLWFPKGCLGEVAALTQISSAMVKHPLPSLTWGLPAFHRTAMGPGSTSQQTPALITPASPEMNLSFFFPQPTKPTHPQRSINSAGIVTRCPSHVPSSSPPSTDALVATFTPPTQLMMV